MSRRWVWLQLLVGWLPMWALLTTLILTAHPETHLVGASLVALRMVVTAAILAAFTRPLLDRLPWPRSFRPAFAGIHLAAAALYSVAWILLNSAVESVLRGQVVLVAGPGLGPFLVLGVWFYVMITGVTYATVASERAARAEVASARAQLEALRAQLNPHFLFNALHTVVQLIPREPGQATKATELLASLLRTSIEEDRDLVSLSEERAFVERYLEIERLRFGDRLTVRIDISDGATSALLPCFSLLTLVENAVRHGVEPKVEPTHVTITGRLDGETLMLTVHDSGGGASRSNAGHGTGHRRLRERLAALYGSNARLDLPKDAGGAHEGFTASLLIPQESEAT